MRSEALAFLVAITTQTFVADSSVFDALLASAKSGNVKSQLKVAIAYDNGDGVGQNLHEAAVWYRKSALNGNRDAQFNLAGIYQSGEGLPADAIKAAVWFRVARKSGSANAVEAERKAFDSLSVSQQMLASDLADRCVSTKFKSCPSE